MHPQQFQTNFKIVFFKAFDKATIELWQYTVLRSALPTPRSERMAERAGFAVRFFEERHRLDFSTEYYVIVIAHNNQPLDSSSARKQIVTVVERKRIVLFIFKFIGRKFSEVDRQWSIVLINLSGMNKQLITVGRLIQTVIFNPFLLEV